MSTHLPHLIFDPELWVDIPLIKDLSKNGISYRVLGRMFGVSSTTIYRIIKGKRYA